MKPKRKIGFLGGQKVDDLYTVEMTGEQLEEYKIIQAKLEFFRDDNGNLPDEVPTQDDSGAVNFVCAYYYTYVTILRWMLYPLQLGSYVAPLTALGGVV